MEQLAFLVGVVLRTIDSVKGNRLEKQDTHV